MVSANSLKFQLNKYGKWQVHIISSSKAALTCSKYENARHFKIKCLNQVVI